MSTAIPYLDEVWNVTTGCGDDMVSPGCLNCYARRMTARNLWGYDFTPTFHADRLEQPLHWRKPRCVGVSFMGDLFHEAITPLQIGRVLDTVTMCPKHSFLVLTKRPERMHEVITEELRATNMSRFLNDKFPVGVIPNVWLGVTVCSQEEADRNIPILLDTPAAVRWVSLEPMLGAVDLRPGLYEEGFDPEYGPLGPTGPGPFLDWVVLGGETGPGARPMQPEWALSVYRQCKAAGVAFWFKSWGREHPFHIPGPELYTQTEYVEMLDLEATHELPAVEP